MIRHEPSAAYRAHRLQQSKSVAILDFATLRISVCARAVAPLCAANCESEASHENGNERWSHEMPNDNIPNDHQVEQIRAQIAAMAEMIRTGQGDLRAAAEAISEATKYLAALGLVIPRD